MEKFPCEMQNWMSLSLTSQASRIRQNSCPPQDVAGRADSSSSELQCSKAQHDWHLLTGHAVRAFSTNSYTVCWASYCWYTKLQFSEIDQTLCGFWHTCVLRICSGRTSHFLHHPDPHLSDSFRLQAAI